MAYPSGELFCPRPHHSVDGPDCVEHDDQQQIGAGVAEDGEGEVMPVQPVVVCQQGWLEHEYQGVQG